MAAPAFAQEIPGDAPAPDDAPALEYLREGWEQHSASLRGWQTGSQLGAVAGGTLGLLLGLAVDSIGEANLGDTVLPNIGLTVGFAAAGAVGAGGIGALVGSAGKAWYPPGGSERARWRLEPHLGLAAADDLDYELYERLHLRAFVPRRFGRWFEAGPDLAWMGLGRDMESWDGRTASTDDTWQAGATARAWVPGGMVEPFFTFGLGWYYRSYSLLGSNYGIGLRMARISCEVRHHIRSSGLDEEPSNNMTTVSMAWAIDL